MKIHRGAVVIDLKTGNTFSVTHPNAFGWVRGKNQAGKRVGAEMGNVRVIKPQPTPEALVNETGACQSNPLPRSEK